ncbi:CPBP family intramembrane glutamic endopeptidase [Butyrivibrio sp. INlla21]|uniref:CPBP family intramembrane glutamic endopeptidase n=1 Tax=Butyrivibrio sp. INlla21 TaxID=1520811 RepID=UPI0008F170FE|nr:CPBP family intramembrane glutamic endopeptidase [Butyrivibrio sp. INlla21]SFU63585.1 CAAX protease self-immunity [Butyrivibrio sp. INlla21]
MENLKLLFGLILGLAISIGCMFFGDTLIATLVPSEPFIGLGELALRLILLLISNLIIRKMYKKSITPSTNNLKKGLFVYGAAMWIVIILNLIMEYQIPEIPLASAMPSIIGLFFSEMGTGVLEELTFRGFFFNAFLDRFGNTKKGVIASMVLSSSVFGLIHLTNLIGNPEYFVSVMAQVIYATLLGCFFCIIYYRTKNIWPCIILHGLVDFTGSFWYVLNTNPVLDESLLYGVLEVTICVVVFISAIVQLNKMFKNKKETPAGEIARK